MFNGCESLKSIDVSGLNTSEVTDASYMFNDCKSLETFTTRDSSDNTVFSFDDSLETVAYMFNNCNALTGLDLRGFGACTGLTSINHWFCNCLHLDYIDLSNFATDESLGNIYYSFNHVGCIDEGNANHGCTVFAKGAWKNSVTMEDYTSEEGKLTFDYFRILMHGQIYRNANDPTIEGKKYYKGSPDHLDVEENPSEPHIYYERAWRLYMGYFSKAYQDDGVTRTPDYNEFCIGVYGE